MTAVAYYSALNGNPFVWFVMWDADSQACGMSKDTLGYPYLYFPSFELEGIGDEGFDAVVAIKKTLERGVCV